MCAALRNCPESLGLLPSPSHPKISTNVSSVLQIGLHFLEFDISGVTLCVLFCFGIPFSTSYFGKNSWVISSIRNIASLNIYVHSCVWTDVLFNMGSKHLRLCMNL